MKTNSHKPFLQRWLPVIRIFLGLVFLFSSVVKGIDPVGTAYRVQDYLQVYGWQALLPYATEIAFLVIFSEFLLGLAFLFRIFIRTAAWGMLVMLTFFTVVTWLDAQYNLVPDCGCFGDAVKLTNWQTFWKNVILIVLSLLFIWGMHGKTREKKSYGRQWVALLLGGGLFLGFMFYNLNHLPVIDFRNWKIGRDMTTVPQKPKRYVVYQNKKTGEKKAFLFPDYPWKDTAWMARWQFVSQHTVMPAREKKYNLIIEDSTGQDHTRELIEDTGLQLFLVSYNLQKADTAGLKKVAALWPFLCKAKVSAVLLTATEAQQAVKIEKRWGLALPVYLADETDLKAMIRSNPGLILLHKGLILKKWHYHDFPDTAQLKDLISLQKK